MTKLESYLNKAHYRSHELEKIKNLMGAYLLPKFEMLQHNRILSDLWNAFGEYTNRTPRHWEDINENIVAEFVRYLDSGA